MWHLPETPGAKQEETAHQMKQETAQGTDTPDYPESPAPPHSEAPHQQPELAEPLQPPSTRPRPPHNIPLVSPSYNRQLQTLKLRPSCSYPDSSSRCSFVPFIHFISNLLDSYSFNEFFNFYPNQTPTLP